MSTSAGDSLHHGSGLAEQQGAAGPDPGSGEPEERQRYRELLEELRTILPGVQVLFAFLLTAPFSQRFAELDEHGRDLYAVALVGTALVTVILMSPASYHRIAPRRARAGRLRTGIRLMVAGMLVLGASIIVAVFTVMRFIFGPGVGVAVASGLVGVLLLLWYVIPLLRRLNVLGDEPRRPPSRREGSNAAVRSTPT
jgi:hypothetical protein